MDQILLCSNHIPPVTTIYNSFIKNEMLDANGSYVKVYLYLSMCIQSGNIAFSISSLADQMDNTEKDIIRALLFWEKRNLILLQRDEKDGQITGIEFLIPEHLPSVEQPAEKIQPDSSFSFSEPNSEPQPEKKEESPQTYIVQITEEQTRRLTSNKDFKWISGIVESFLERPLSQGEIRFLMYLYDNLGFSKDLILHLYEYCCSLGKTKLPYVQAVAFSWADNNVATPEQAQRLSADYNALYTSVAKSFGLNRALGSIELQYVHKWSKEWSFDAAVIIEACNRTLLSIQKADFKYADGILSNWHQNKVHSLQDVQVCDENHNKKRAAGKPASNIQRYPYGTSSNTPKRNQFQAFQQRELSTEDMKQLEKRLLSR